MILMTLDFWGIVLLLLYGGALLLAYRLTWWLAKASERVIAFLTQTGLHGMAKGLLAILIGYDQQTYLRSRFIYWNQAHVRFAILWGSFLVLAGILLLLQQMHTIGSVGQAWTFAFIALVGFRCLAYWTHSKTHLISTEEPSLKSLIQDVNERSPLQKRSGLPVIRRYDYLDALFAEQV